MSTIILFLLFVLPLVVFPFGVSPFEIPKVILAEIGIELLLVFYLIGKGRFSKFFPYLSLLFLSFLHLIFLRTSTTLFGNSFRLQGVFLLWHLMIFAFLISSGEPLKYPSYLPSFALIFLLFSTLVLSPNEVGRAVGTLGEPNALAAAAIFLWPFIFFAKKNYFKMISPILALIIVFLSGSRSGLIALVIQIFYITLTRCLKISTAKAVVLGLFFLALSLFLPFLEKDLFFENRVEVWKTAFYAGFRHPLFGNGFGNTQFAIQQTAIALNNRSQYQFVDSSHNLLLDWWTQGGIVGLAILVFLIFSVLRVFLTRQKSLEITLLLGLLTVMSFNPASVVTLVGFWWLIGRGFTDPGSD